MRSRLSALWRNLVHRHRVEQDLDDELRSYLEMTVRDKQSAGLSEDDARRAARVDLGGIEQVKEQVRDARTGSMLEQVLQDLGYAVRLMRRNTGFTVVTAATLGLGIGASTAVFTLVDTVVFRRLPYAAPERLLKICGTGERDSSCDDDFSRAELDALRSQSTTFEQIAADDGTGAAVVWQDGSRESVGVGLVSVNWLSTLGVRPAVGRDFTIAEGEPGRNRVVILMDDYWRRRFDANPHVLGATLALDGVAHTVVGIAPANVLRSYADVLKPLVVADYTDRSLDVFARLKPGVTAAQARAEVAVIGGRLEQATPHGVRRRLDVEPLGKYYAGVEHKATEGLTLVLGAVALVLLIACANVANLLLVRANIRRREFVVRSALGASRSRLVRQFLVEGLLLFVLGGGLGILMARAALTSLAALAIAGGYLPERMAVTVDLRVLCVSLLASLVTGLGFGLLPALQASKVDLNPGLRGSSQTMSAGPGSGRASRLLIVGELALSLVLLAGFGLLVRSVERLYGSSLGFDPENLLVTGSDGGRSFPEAMAFWRAALARADAVPGTTFVALTSRLPLHGARQQRFTIDGDPPLPADESPQAGDIMITQDYFRATGLGILNGRPFDDTDQASSKPVAIISDTLARRYFTGRNPIGRRIRVLERSPMTCCTSPAPVEGVWREIVGVVADVRQANLDEPPAATLYRPVSQIVEHDMFLVVRADSAPAAARIGPELQQQLTAVDPAREWWDVRPMSRVIRESESIRLRRFVLILLGGFAGIALVLAAIGIYAVSSGAVAARTKEIGVRIALGATRATIFRQMLREMVVLAMAGTLGGAAAAVALTRLIRALLFGVGGADPVTYLSVASVLGLVVLLAAWVPARRAMRIDPLTALRHE